MTPCCRVLTATLLLFAANAVEAQGRQLLEIDGIELRGSRSL